MVDKRGKICYLKAVQNARKRSSTGEPAYRKLPEDARQRKEQRELALERPYEILRESRCGRIPTVRGAGYMHFTVPVSDEGA